jgi:hypothetical protein
MKKATSSALVKDELEQTITLINSLDTWQLQTLEEEIRNLQEKMIGTKDNIYDAAHCCHW